MIHPSTRLTAPVETVETAVTHVVDSGLRRLSVIDGSGHMVGIVSRNDLMTAIEREMWT
jgi:CBS-domain-containing membrane protein